jgi:chromosome partitioning protein
VEHRDERIAGDLELLLTGAPQSGEDVPRAQRPLERPVVAIWRKNREEAPSSEVVTPEHVAEVEPVPVASSTEGQDETTGSGAEIAPDTAEVSQDSSETGSDAPPPLSQAIADQNDVISEEAGPELSGDDEDLEDDELDVPIIDEEQADLRSARPVRDLPRIMAVANQKGGVGKTTTTINLGAALAELGYRVLVIDLDPQGNATTGLGIERKNFEHSMYDVIMREHPLEDVIEATSVRNLFVAPATLDLSGVEIELVPAFSRELRLKRALEPIIDDFDFVMIDCPPSLGLITINALAAADEVLVPIQCEYYALEGLSQLRSTLKLVAGNLNQELEMSTIVLTMYDARTRLAADVAADVREHFPDQVCDTIIPRTVRLSEAPSFGQPITTFDPASRGASAYRDLAKEVSNGAPKRAG